MDQPSLDLIEAISDRFPASERKDVVLFLEAAAGRSLDAQGLDSRADRRELIASIARGRALVEGMVKRGDLVKRQLMRETGLDL